MRQLTCLRDKKICKSDTKIFDCICNSKWLRAIARADSISSGHVLWVLNEQTSESKMDLISVAIVHKTHPIISWLASAVLSTEMNAKMCILGQDDIVILTAVCARKVENISYAHFLRSFNDPSSLAYVSVTSQNNCKEMFPSLAIS